MKRRRRTGGLSRRKTAPAGEIQEPELEPDQTVVTRTEGRGGACDREVCSGENANSQDLTWRQRAGGGLGFPDRALGLLGGKDPQPSPIGELASQDFRRGDMDPVKILIRVGAHGPEDDERRPKTDPGRRFGCRRTACRRSRYRRPLRDQPHRGHQRAGHRHRGHEPGFPIPLR